MMGVPEAPKCTMPIGAWAGFDLSYTWHTSRYPAAMKP